jgi:hypothetical protein
MGKDGIKQTHRHKDKPNQGSLENNKNSGSSIAPAIMRIIIITMVEVTIDREDNIKMDLTEIG